MREILFRGKRKDNGEWVEGYFGIKDGYSNEKIYCIMKPTFDMRMEYSYFTDYEVIPETVGQYTGLTDNNGEKIFEGDIVRFAKNIYQIVFTVGSFALYDERGKMLSKIGGCNDHCYSLMDLYVECAWEDDWAYDIEIIGNIHDNPELL